MTQVQNEKFTSQATGDTAGAASQTLPLLTIRKGYRFVSLLAEVLTPGATGTNSTFAVQDANAVVFLAATNTTLDNNPAGKLIDCAGAGFNQAGGTLYIADVALNVVFTKGTTPGVVNPVWRFRALMRREYP